MSEPDNSHVMPMLVLHLAGIAMTVMSAVGLYSTVFNGMRVRSRNGGVEWTVFESLALELAILGIGVATA